MYNAGVEIVLNGHNHNYERFAPQTPKAITDSKRGIQEFVIGNRGKNFYPFTHIQPNSEVRNNQTFGVLKLTLHPDRYDWQMVPEEGKTFTGSGSSPCH